MVGVLLSVSGPKAKELSQGRGGFKGRRGSHLPHGTAEGVVEPPAGPWNDVRHVWRRVVVALRDRLEKPDRQDLLTEGIDDQSLGLEVGERGLLTRDDLLLKDDEVGLVAVYCPRDVGIEVEPGRVLPSKGDEVAGEGQVVADKDFDADGDLKCERAVIRGPDPEGGT